MHLPSLKPLENIRITFGYEPVLGRACALHFVVGVNGSGKSRLMRALAEIFLCMERGSAIPFPFTLVYDLGPNTGEEYAEGADEGNTALAFARHTIYLHRSEQRQTVLADFDYIASEQTVREQYWDVLASSDWEHFDHSEYNLRIYYRGDNLPNVYLPNVMLTYTSGAIHEWEALFAPQRTEAQDILVAAFNELKQEEERPVGWNTLKEADQRQQQEPYIAQEVSDEESATLLDVEYESARASGIGIFVPLIHSNLLSVLLLLIRQQKILHI